MHIGLNIHEGVSGYYEFRLRAPNGKITRFRNHPRPKKNIITDNGLDSCFARTFLASMAYLVVGTGTTAATTSDTGLAAYLATSNSMSASECGYLDSFSGRYIDHYRTFFWTNNTGVSKTITEVGMTWLSTSNPAVFSRVVISGGLSIPAGYDLIVKYTLRKHVPIWRNPQSVNISVNGTTQSGTTMLACAATAASDTSLRQCFTYPSATGAETYDFHFGYLLEPSSAGDSNDRYAHLGTTTQFSGLLTETGNLLSTMATVAGGYSWVLSLGTYTPGSFTRSKYYKLDAADYPATSFRSVAVGCYYYPLLVWDGDASFTKAANHSWTFGITISLARE